MGLLDCCWPRIGERIQMAAVHYLCWCIYFFYIEYQTYLRVFRNFKCSHRKLSDCKSSTEYFNAFILNVITWFLFPFNSLNDIPLQYYPLNMHFSFQQYALCCVLYVLEGRLLFSWFPLPDTHQITLNLESSFAHAISDMKLLRNHRERNKTWLKMWYLDKVGVLQEKKQFAFSFTTHY